MDPAPRRTPGAIAFLVTIALVASLSVACGSSPSSNRIDDAFYATPSPIPSSPPGTIVRSETMAAPFDGSQAWRVMYTSTSFDGSAIVVTGTVVAPTGPAPAGGRPVVSWAHPTTGIVDACAPSRVRDPFGDVQGLQEFLADGWVVVATDYQGLGTDGMHPYLIGSSEARGAIDIVRAARSLDGVGASSTYALFGHSQGGQGVLFGGQMAATYAPDLRLAGVAAAAPAGELVELFDADKDTMAGAVLGSYAIESWSALYGYDVGTVVRSNFERRVASISKKCVVGGSRLDDLLLGIDDLILKGRMWKADPSSTPPWSEQFATNTPGGAPIPVPVLVTQGTDDTIVRPWTTTQLVSRYRANGTSITETTMTGVDHMKAGRMSVPIVVPFLRSQFAASGAPA